MEKSRHETVLNLDYLKMVSSDRGASSPIINYQATMELAKPPNLFRQTDMLVCLYNPLLFSYFLLFLTHPKSFLSCLS